MSILKKEKILGTTEVLRNVPGLVGKLHEAKEAYATAIVITQKELGRYHQSVRILMKSAYIHRYCYVPIDTVIYV